ncbi:hypothetical protein I317_03054 [Kwoniella heveanensis CBS 569]|nr:hypothetical protein I317_03054 [Kwoniella heveanensis CBS 569]
MSCTPFFPANVTAGDKCCFDSQVCADYVCSALDAPISKGDNGNQSAASNTPVCYINRTTASRLFNEANRIDNSTCHIMLCLPNPNTSAGVKALDPLTGAPWLLWLGVVFVVSIWNGRK